MLSLQVLFWFTVQVNTLVSFCRFSLTFKNKFRVLTLEYVSNAPRIYCLCWRHFTLESGTFNLLYLVKLIMQLMPYKNMLFKFTKLFSVWGTTNKVSFITVQLNNYLIQAIAFSLNASLTCKQLHLCSMLFSIFNNKIHLLLFLAR